MIQSFRGKEAEHVWARRHSRTLDPTVQRAAYRKLLIIDAADSINDLRVPPGNRLEKLVGDRIGQHSVRINDQWRICFTWTTTGPTNVETADYH